MATTSKVVGYKLPVNSERQQGKVAQGFITPKQDKLPQVHAIPPKRVLPIIFIPGIMGSNLRMSAARQAQLKKYAYVACEALSSEVWSITEAVLEYKDHLREFWEYLRRPAPLDPLQAGYFTKVNETLLDKKTEDMFAFLRSLDGIVPELLKHVDCPMVMDLLLKMISLEKSDGGQGIVDVSISGRTRMRKRESRADTAV